MFKETPFPPPWLFPILSWIVALYFLTGAWGHLGLPPKIEKLDGPLVLATLALVFIFLPFFRHIKISKLIELERELKETKTSLQEFKSEIRNTLNVLSTNVNTLGNVSSNVTLNIPGLAELQETKKELEQLPKPEGNQQLEELKRSVQIDSDDLLNSLATARIQIERYLRRILGKRTETGKDDRGVRFMTLRKLFELFEREYPDYQAVRSGFEDINHILNAAVHGQIVPKKQAIAAFEIAADMVTILRQLAGENEKA